MFDQHTQNHIWSCLKSTFPLTNILKIIFGRVKSQLFLLQTYSKLYLDISKVNFFFEKHTKNHIWTCKLYIIFNLLFNLMLFFQIFTYKPLFLILNFQHINSCDFKKIIIPKDLEIENGVLGLDRDCYLSIVKFLNSPCKKSLSKYLCLISIPFVIVHWN
jgi:hypothetical protein